MKIYGNASTDGFPALLAVVGALFVLGGVGLANVGGAALLVGFPALGVLVAVMVKKLANWDVTSEVEHIETELSGDIAVRFPVSAQSDTSARHLVAPWAPAITTDLPMHVAKPAAKTVETNTHVG